MRQTVLSGIRSTGHLHLGNYMGAVRNFVQMQKEYDCYFFIADYHSLTTHPKPKDLHNNVRQVLIEYLAAGINPEEATLYIQSDVPEIAELYLLLNMNAYLGELERSASFKDKIRSQPENINAGLLTYPTLMAADILIHKAEKVPVGKDQQQHLEMARTFANRFNRLYETDYFKEPFAFNFGKELIKVPGLGGKGKMSKSDNGNNAVFLNDSSDDIRKKIMRAVTDSGPVEKNSPMSESIANIFNLMRIVSKPDTVKFFEDKYRSCTIRYGDLKKQLAEDMVEFIAPISERIEEISSDEDYIKKTARKGAEKARLSARKTIEEVRKIIGIKPF